MLSWLNNRRVGTKLAANVVIMLVALATIAGAALWVARDQMLDDRRAKLKAILDTTAGIAAELDKKVQAGAMTEADGLKRLIDVVRAERFDGTNYIALYRPDGVMLAFAPDPSLEGQNRIGLTDPNGVKIIGTAIDIVQNRGAGFYSYQYPRPGGTAPVPKMSYTRGLGFGGVFGIAGIYVDDVDAAVYGTAGLFAMVALPLILLIAASAWAMQRSVAGGLGKLSGVMGRLAAGDFAAEVPGLERGDELGRMAQAVQVFKEAGIEKGRLEDENRSSASAAQAERTRTDHERRAAAAQQAEVVDALAAGLAGMAEGDLTAEIGQAFAADYERLRTDFNRAAGQLRQVLGTVLDNAASIRMGTREISTAADDLSRRTEQQAASLEETAAALDEITATVKKTSEGANHARQVVSNAKSDAERSGQVVSRAIQAMTAIEKSSQQIGQIIGVIDEIAFQTNLLALNAGVEAARAGDAGKGFAVVASEVRGLAQRSAEAAKEIKALISTSTTQVEDGVHLVGETGDALAKIAGQVAEINAVVTDIAASASEQATGLDQVNTAVNQMDQVTQQNATMVEQTTAASHKLAKDTEDLERLVAQFNVGKGTASSTAPRARSVAPSSKAVSRPMRAAKTVMAAAMKTVGRGGAAPKPAAEPEQGWEEF